MTNMVHFTRQRLFVCSRCSMLRILISMLFLCTFLASAEAKAKIELLGESSSHVCSDDYLVPKMDYFFIRVRFSGNDTDSTFDAFYGPSLQYTELDSDSDSIHCYLYDTPHTGFCDGLAEFSQNRCSCKEESQNVYIVSVNLTIGSVDFSEMTFLIVWFNKNDIVNSIFENVDLPKVEATPEPSPECVACYCRIECWLPYVILCILVVIAVCMALHYYEKVYMPCFQCVKPKTSNVTVVKDNSDNIEMPEVTHQPMTSDQNDIVHAASQ